MMRAFVAYILLSISVANVLAHPNDPTHEECPSNCELKRCGSRCEPTCTNQSQTGCVVENADDCEFECRCIDGYVRDEDSRECKKPSECPSETSSTEMLIIGKPITDKPVTHKPVTDKPVTGKPVTDKPVTGKPVTDKPVTGKPVTDNPVTGKPVTDKPVTSKPVTDKPVTGKPVTDKPVTHKPVTDKPVTDKPVTHNPVTGKPVTDKPVTGKPVTDEPTTDKPVTDKPVTHKPVTAKPVTDKPVTDKPITDKPVTDKPVTHKPVTDKPVTGKPVTDKPVTGKPVTDKPVTGKPVTGKPTTDKPVTHKPVTDKPVTGKPVTDKPTQTCSDNEILSPCEQMCEPSCDNRKPNSLTCPKIECNQSTEVCRCKKDLYRDKRTDKCVLLEDCPDENSTEAPTKPTCGPNEEIGDCGKRCECTCTDRDNSKCDTLKCSDQGCRCKEGYVRDENSESCTLPENCPKTNSWLGSKDS